MKVLVNGVSGRLGPWVVKELAEHGHEVVLFSRRPPPPEIDRWSWIQGDINRFEDCQKALQSARFDAVHHLAAQSWPVDHPALRADADRQGLPFDATMRSNLLGTYYMLMASLQAGVEIFVMTGSNCALGHGYRVSQRPFPYCYLPVDEDHPSDVEDSYSYSKLAGEELLASFTRAYGMRTYALRSAGICDEAHRRQMAQKVRPVKSWNDWLWCWVSSEDVASAHRLLMEKARKIKPHGVYFCNGNDTTALEPTRELVARFAPSLLPLIKELPDHASLISNHRLRQLGWEHKMSWRQYLPEA